MIYILLFASQNSIQKIKGEAKKKKKNKATKTFYEVTKNDEANFSLFLLMTVLVNLIFLIVSYFLQSVQFYLLFFCSVVFRFSFEIQPIAFAKQTDWFV